LELVRKRLPPDEKNLVLIDNAMQAARRGATLTQRMLAFARRQELDPELASVHELVTGMTSLFDHTLGPAIVLDIDCPKSLSPVKVDTNQMEMALLNLVVNARDAMPRGGVIAISAAEIAVTEAMAPSLSLKEGHYVRLQVKDQGHGMDATTLARAAEPFFTTKGVGKGTGLGLPMVLGTAEQLGGRLELQSQLGQGTTAALWLPVSQPSLEPLSAAKEAQAPSAVPGPPLRVLAVDDDALVLMNTVALLEDLGHEVVEANSGREALKIMSEDAAFDLIITDQAMPSMTGSQLISEVSRQWPQIPIILATGYSELPDDLPPHVRRLGKPFWQADLQTAIADSRAAKSRR
jgi:CheY-like chemotaxis protein